MRGLGRDRGAEPLSPIFPATTTPFLSKRKDLKVFSLCLFYYVTTILSESLAQGYCWPIVPVLVASYISGHHTMAIRDQQKKKGNYLDRKII